MQLEQITTIRVLEGIREEWSELIQKCPEATPFQTPEWMLPWWRRLGGGELTVLAARQGGNLVALAPWFIHVWQGRRQVSPLGVSVSDHFDFICLPEFELEFARLALEALQEQRSCWDVCVLPELRSTSPLLRTDVPAHLRVEIEPLDVCPVLVLPKRLEDMESALDPHLRRNLRRDQKMLDRLGGGIIEEANVQTLDEFMDALFRLHTARWQTEEQPGVLASLNVQDFHREVAAGFEQRGMLRLYGLLREGIVTSVMYDFALGGCVYAYLSGYDPRLDQASPGKLLTWHAIRQAIVGGSSKYDFLRGSESHKHIWGAQDRQNFRMVLSPN